MEKTLPEILGFIKNKKRQNDEQWFLIVAHYNVGKEFRKEFRIESDFDYIVISKSDYEDLLAISDKWKRSMEPSKNVFFIKAVQRILNKKEIFEKI